MYCLPLFYSLTHPSSRAFLSLSRFCLSRQRLCLNWVWSFLSMRGMLLGYSFEPSPYRRVLDTAGSAITIGLSINGCSHWNKPVWWEKTRWSSPEVWAAATSNAWRNSRRIVFSPFHSRRQKKGYARRMSLTVTDCSVIHKGKHLINR